LFFAGVSEEGKVTDPIIDDGFGEENRRLGLFIPSIQVPSVYWPAGESVPSVGGVDFGEAGKLGGCEKVAHVQIGRRGPVRDVVLEIK